MKRRFVSILCAATMVASLMTGATVVSAADKDVKDISIGVSFGQNVHPFFVAMQKGIEQACTDLGVENCNILAADSSLETQVSQIENLVTKGSDVLLLNPYDSDGVVNAVEAATEKGVGVFTMDVDCEGSTSFVASDNKKVGEMLADAVIEQLDGKGKIATAENMSAIRDGKVAIGVSQDPYKMGYTAVEQAIKWYQGEEPEEFIEVPVEYMDKENIQDFIDREKGYGVEVE